MPTQGGFLFLTSFLGHLDLNQCAWETEFPDTHRVFVGILSFSIPDRPQ